MSNTVIVQSKVAMSLNQKKKTKERKQRKFSVLIATAIAGIVMVSAFVFVNQQIDINKLSQEKAIVAEKLDEQQKQNEDIAAVVDSEDKDEYVARIAREKFGYAKPGEEIYYDIS